MVIDVIDEWMMMNDDNDDDEKLWMMDNHDVDSHHVCDNWSAHDGKA